MNTNLTFAKKTKTFSHENGPATKKKLPFSRELDFFGCGSSALRFIFLSFIFLPLLFPPPLFIVAFLTFESSRPMATADAPVYSKPSLFAKAIAQLRVLYLAIATIATLTLGMLLVVIASVLTLGQAKSWITYHAGRAIGRTVLWFAGVKLKLEQIGARAQEPAVYISNHSSTLDIFIIVALGLPAVRFVAKYELMYNPLFAILGILTGQIFIKRQDSAKAISVLNRAYERIRKQRLSLFMAPEGTRITSGQIGPFKKGAFRMALDLKYPIVPIHFAGARQLCPGKTFVVNPGTAYARFYSPIDTSTWTTENLDGHVEAIRGEYVRWEREFESLINREGAKP